MGSIIWTANMRTSLLFVCSFIAVGITVPVPDPDIQITMHCHGSLCNQDNVLDGVEGPPEKIVLSSEGEAANVQGGVLGEYSMTVRRTIMFNQTLRSSMNNMNQNIFTGMMNMKIG